MVSRARGVALVGLDGHPIDVEVHVGSGLPSFTIVGLPDASITEARERVRAAIGSSGEKWPQQRVTVNLSPAHLRKAGSMFDLAMALGVLAEDGRVPREALDGVTVIGELSLDGHVRGVPGVLPATLTARHSGATTVVVPAQNAAEAALVPGLRVVGVGHLRDAVGYLRTGSYPPVPEPGAARPQPVPGDLQDVRGNWHAKRALAIAAAGGHNLFMIGPPGAGKTMLARRLPAILPPLGDDEAFEVTRIHSVAGLLDGSGGLVRTRPFRAPHHGASLAGMIGGGSGLPHPGEVSLAHRGVLFLDEMAEFRREVLQGLRQPLEDGTVTIVRSRFAVSYPARFQLIAASNPCPCGMHGDDLRRCRCDHVRVAAYRARLRGPVMDRIDLQVQVERIRKGELFAAPDGTATTSIAQEVARAREAQRERFGDAGPSCNADVGARDIDVRCKAEPAALVQLDAAIDSHWLSGRGAHRVLRVARTVADIEGSVAVTADHVREALEFRVAPEAL